MATKKSSKRKLRSLLPDVKAAAANDTTNVEPTPVPLTPEQIIANDEKASPAPAPVGGKLSRWLIAGKPNADDYRLVYGPEGYKMTWPERIKAGVTPEDFQRVLAEKRTTKS